jgi:hypothetical protein
MKQKGPQKELCLEMSCGKKDRSFSEPPTQNKGGYETREIFFGELIKI